MPDKYKAVWVSFSSISDYLKCPRLYFLKNIYKTPSTGRKIEVTQPPLSLGSAVHKTLEPLAFLPIKQRFVEDLENKFIENYDKYKGKFGGFSSEHEFEIGKEMGLEMIQRVVNNPEPLSKETFHNSQDLLHGWLSSEKEIIVCGKIDWINKLDNGTLEILDFKTGQKEENNDLQLQVYALLLLLLNKTNVNSLNYWYLRLNDNLTSVDLPDIKESKLKVLEIAEVIKAAREANSLKCPRNGCWHCRDFEEVFNGNAEMVGLGEYNREIYFVES